MPDLKEWNSVQETADYLGKHYQTIHLWIRKGILAYSQPVPGGRKLISAESINAMLNNGKKEDADGR